MDQFDIALIGGGIVGVSTALAVKTRYPKARVILIEKENRLAVHQTGHNSGVIHAGVYYEPGSLKADFCKRGARATMDFCKTHNLPFRQCGKLLVATTPLEMERMKALEDRCSKNKIHTQLIDKHQLNKMEPHIFGLGALLVSATGITDYTRITAKSVPACVQRSFSRSHLSHPDWGISMRQGQNKIQPLNNFLAY